MVYTSSAKRLAFALLVLIVFSYQIAIAALTICQRPSGVANREIAHDDLSALRNLIQERFAEQGPFLLVVRMPSDIQIQKRFLHIEREELKKDAEFRDLVSRIQSEVAVGGKQQISNDELQNKILDEYFKKAKKDDEVGMVYLYTDEGKLLKKLSPQISDDHGIVIEGNLEEINTLLTTSDQSSKEFGWWKSIMGLGAKTIVTVGFGVSPKIRSLASQDAQVLKIRDYQTATESGLKKLRRILNVGPTNATVLNLFPSTAQQAKPWGFSEDKANAYVREGKKFRDEYSRLGYEVAQPEQITGMEALDFLRSQTARGKRVLVIAETAVSTKGDSFLRLPGLEGTLTASDLSTLGQAVLSDIFIVSCNSQALTEQSPLSVAGTIYTDVANRLIRMTFASGQADTFSDYLDLKSNSKDHWASVIADGSSALRASLSRQAEMEIVGQQFNPVATVYQVNGVPTNIVQPSPVFQPTAQPSSGGSPVGRLPTAPYRPDLVFASGTFGALCREGLRWKRLIEKGRAKAYLRLPYVLLSCGLMVAAGAVALIFVESVPLGSFVLPISFVAGAGFEKIVKMAATLKVWNPVKSLPMGSTADGSTEDMAEPSNDFVPSDSIISFLRHGG
jgi:hypothetical protein